MKKKILIIGVNSFIGSNLYFLSKEKLDIKIIHYSKFLQLKNKDLINITHIINCASNKRYVNFKYIEKNDFDVEISKKIKDLKCKMIFLSTRKVYSAADNIKENGIIGPSCNYSKNKMITENKIKKTLKERVLILRISNLIGLSPRTNRRNKIHSTFIDQFFKNIRKNYFFDNLKIYKDFLPITKFCEIVRKLINKDVIGTFNVSLGEKVYLNDIVSDLNFYNKTKFNTINIPKHFNNECFYLNNKKLRKTINITINLITLKKYCKLMSKSFFKNK